MVTSTERPVVLVQKLITSYFTASAPTESSSRSLRSISESSDSGYVFCLETPVSKQGNIAFYLGQCNRKDGSRRRALFGTSQLATYSSSPFFVANSLSSMRLPCESSSDSCSFVPART